MSSKAQELADVIAQRKKLQEEARILAEEKLVKLNQDKSGVLEVTIRDVRNETVGAAEGSGEIVHKRFVVSVDPGTILAVADGEKRVEIKELGGVAKFSVSSLEAKAVIQFGAHLQHTVRVPLFNKYKDLDLEKLSTWHSVAPGEATETPGIQDVTEVPQVKLGFKYRRGNQEECAKVKDKVKQLQEQIGSLTKKEKSLKVGGTPTAGSQGGNEAKAAGGEARITLFGMLATPFLLVPKFAKALAKTLWARRAVAMFVGGAAFFHYYGDDFAV